MVSERAKKIVFKLVILCLVTPLVYYTSTGEPDPLLRFQPPIFIVGLMLALFLPHLRLKIILLSLSLFVIMIGFYLAKVQQVADFLGGTGFGLIVLITLTYSKEVFEKGYIEDFKKWFQNF